MDINPLYVPAIIGGVFGFITGVVTHYLTSRRTISDLKRSNLQKELENVYVPITNIIDSSVEPTYGYEGLSNKDVDEIAKIAKDNAPFIDVKLKRLIDGLLEDQYIMERSEVNYPIYDENRKLLKYAFYKYNLLRKQLRLPYDNNYFVIRSLFSNLKEKYWILHRKFDRWIRKIKRKNK